MALNIKCGYQFKSPALTGESKADKEALEKLRTFDFKSLLFLLSLRAYLAVVSKKKCHAADRYDIAARHFCFDLEELRGDGCKTGFWQQVRRRRRRRLRRRCHKPTDDPFAVDLFVVVVAAAAVVVVVVVLLLLLCHAAFARGARIAAAESIRIIISPRGCSRS